MISIEELDKIGALAEQLDFDYLHNTDKSWVDFVDRENRVICVEYDDVERHDYIGIHLLCGDSATPRNARDIYKHYPIALVLLKLLEDAPKTRRCDDDNECDDDDE
jgi:hypothetical protein